MNILVTGAGGFIGKSFLNHFLKKYKILSVKHSEGFGAKENEFSLELASAKHVGELISNLLETRIDTVFHFAAVTPFSHQNPEVNFVQDLEMAQQVKNICYTLKIPRLVFTSGWIVYDSGNKIPISESSPLHPNTDYGRSKLKVEEYFKRTLKGTVFINLRLSSVYGPGQLSSGLIPNLVRSALETKRMTINSIETKRDYLYINDLMVAFERLISLKFVENVDLNIGSGKSFSVLDVALTIQRILYEKYGHPADLLIQQPLTVAVPKDNLLDVSKAKKVLGWESQTDLGFGLLRYIEWMMKRG